MDFCKRLVSNPLIMIFLVIIFAVPVTQAVVEYHKSGHIQAFDLFVDLTATPFINANRMHALAEKESAYADSIGAALANPGDSSSDRLDLLLDEASATADELKKTALTKNRHIRLDSSHANGRIDTLALLLSDLTAAVHGGSADASALLASIKSKARSLGKEFPHRSALSIPQLSIENIQYILWNDHYIRPYEKEIENSSVFALAVRPRMQFLSYLAFRDLGEKGILGRHGWFFYRPDVDFVVKPYVRDPRSIAVDPNDRPLADDPVTAIRNFKEQLNRRGIDLLMVIMPGKPSIYPDLLSPGVVPASAGHVGHSPDMVAELRRAGVEAVDLFTPFAQERLRDQAAGDSLYLREDTHWKSRAVRLAASVVAARVKQYPWYRTGSTEYAIDSVTIDRIGDVGVMTTLPAEKVHRFYGSFAPEKTKCYQVYRVERDATGAVADRILYKDDFRSSQILLLGDSFSRIYQTDQPRSAGWISHLAFELSQPIASLVNDGGASTLVRRSLARNPGLLKGKKLVIWEVVERDFRFGEEGWKDVAIADTVTHSNKPAEVAQGTGNNSENR